MFPFSPRKTTPAAEMDNQIPKAIKTQRGQIVRQLETELRDEYYKSLGGETLQLLVEDVDAEGTARGTSCRYGAVKVMNSTLADNDLADVKIVGTQTGHLVGQQL